jgi:hypothetical protein
MNRYPRRGTLSVNRGSRVVTENRADAAVRAHQQACIRFVEFMPSAASANQAGLSRRRPRPERQLRRALLRRRALHVREVMTSGSSVLALILRVPPQRAQPAISMPNTGDNEHGEASAPCDGRDQRGHAAGTSAVGHTQ